MERRKLLQAAAVMTVMPGSFWANLWAASNSTTRLQWYRELKAAHKVAVKTDRPMMIVFGASWCGFCHKLERETLSDAGLVKLIQARFVPVHLDFDKHRRTAEILGVESLPATVILSPEAEILASDVGFASVKGFTELLEAALDRQAEIQQAQHSESMSEMP